MRLMIELDVKFWDADLPSIYRAEDGSRLLDLLNGRLRGLDAIQIVSRPSYRFQFSGDLAAERRKRVEDALDRLYVSVRTNRSGRDLDDLMRLQVPGLRIGADVPLGSFDNWCPAGDAPTLFHERAAADALIAADALRARGMRGTGVNLVIVDEGLHAASLKARFPELPGAGAGEPHLVGGWDVLTPPDPPRLAGQGVPDGHGTMVALNALSLAPAARVFDLPLLPDRIHDVTRYTLLMAAALTWVRAEIRVWLGTLFPGPWVFSHAWGIYDRRFEQPKGNYTGDPNHPLNLRVQRCDEDWGYDQVFAAGNCGQFCPNGRCGPADRGPGDSILGANSSPHVLTVGAVRADGAWIGYSAQGPGQPGFPPPPGAGKPDLCTPSHFVEAGDGHFLSSGTSAACGLAAGAVAALRGANSPVPNMSTAALRDLLRRSARKPTELDPLRHGSGILDLQAALEAAPVAAEAGQGGPSPGAST